MWFELTVPQVQMYCKWVRNTVMSRRAVGGKGHGVGYGKNQVLQSTLL